MKVSSSMSTQSLNRSPSDFSGASNISLARSTYADVFDSGENTPLLGVSVQSPQTDGRQGSSLFVIGCHIFFTVFCGHSRSVVMALVASAKLRRARLVLGLVTTFGGSTLPVFIQAHSAWPSFHG